jgi:hypothetical protein
MKRKWKSLLAGAMSFLAVAVLTSTACADVMTVDRIDGVNGAWQMSIVNASTATLTFTNSFTTRFDSSAVSPVTERDTVFTQFSISRTPNASGGFNATILSSPGETIYSSFTQGFTPPSNPIADFTLFTGVLSGSGTIYGLAGNKVLQDQANPTSSGFDFSPFFAGASYEFSFQGVDIAAFLENPNSHGSVGSTASFTEIAVPLPASMLMMSMGTVLLGAYGFRRKK